MRFVHVTLAVVLGCGASSSPEPDAAPTEAERSWRDEVVYQLLTDRFGNGRVDNDTGETCSTCYLGGDWVGINQRLDYLQDLGVTAIWISPIATNVDDVIGGGYHGFWPLALDQANPRFGTEEELRTLVDACHDRGIKVLVDVVLNHMGQVFFYDLNGNGQPDPGELDPPFNADGIDAPIVFKDAVSPAGFLNPDWYHRRGGIQNFDDPLQALTGDFEGGLRDLDTARQDVRDALLEVTLDWLDRVPFDGIRFDAAKHVDEDFWPWFLGELRAARPGLVAVAEAFEGDVTRLSRFTDELAFDSVLDFSYKYQAFNDVFAANQPTTRLRDLYVAQSQALNPVPHQGGAGLAPQLIPFRFLDNHDVPRFMSTAGDVRAVKAALAYLMTLDGVPVIYYGTEQDFSGAEDPENREALWTSDYLTDGDTFVWLRRLISLRAELTALRRGDVRFVWTSSRQDAGDGAGLVGIERVLADERVLVVVNTRASEAETAAGGTGMQVGFEPGTVLEDRLTNGESLTVGDDGRITVQMPGYGARIYTAR
ncbi:MAG: hypothetical protein KJO07_07980 [Deltaproteobacteria bacterium]|nr:hypothetical protein [Deltaproteobacteria bacterium]